MLKRTTNAENVCWYPTGEDVNMRDISFDTEKEMVQHDHKEVITKQYISEKDDPNNSTNQNNENPENENPAQHNEEKVTNEQNEKYDY